MISNYIPTDSEGNIDLSRELTEDDFLEKTFLSVRYRTLNENEEFLDKPGEKSKNFKIKKED